MTPEQFYDKLKDFNIELTENQKWQLHRYWELLVEWNEKMNLTGITELNEVYLKHYYDSVIGFLMFEEISECQTLCDVGSGAGFPALPVKIIFPHLKMDLVDSLGKRVTFLNHVISETGLEHIHAHHSRAEEFVAKNRETFDVVTARAVARLNMLSELCIPLVKEGGYFIALKGQTGAEELEESKKAMSALGVELIAVNHIELPEDAGSRTNIYTKKYKKTPVKYPRAFGQIKNKPLK
ncbi:MAG: 16S rRNA (guanine(527)-N(7))-methyltransferase RsmG [Turicibacter sp.]|nr:16S rRNA (guanine(527)-N(7))-methyltransferase RsmG [Turicibacter sp.]